MSLPAAAVIGGAVTLWLAIGTQDGLVADDYYKQGLEVNRVIARAEKAQAMGLGARVLISSERAEVALRALPQTDLPDRIQLSITHPTRAGKDRRLWLARAGDRYVGDIRGLPAGHWKLSVEDAAASWRLVGDIQLPLPAVTELGAATPNR